jgi:uncharacterized protein (DUF58 family)
MLVYALLAAWVVVMAGFLAHAQKPKFDVTISSPAAEFFVGSPVLVNVTIVSHSDHDLLFHVRMSPDRAGIIVRDDHQIELEPREEWRKEKERQGWFSFSGESVEPSKRLNFNVEIGRWFDLKPGVYTIQLAPEGTSIDGPRERQKSNVLQIEITSK